MSINYGIMHNAKKKQKKKKNISFRPTSNSKMYKYVAQWRAVPSHIVK